MLSMNLTANLSAKCNIIIGYIEESVSNRYPLLFRIVYFSERKALKKRVIKGQLAMHFKLRLC